VNLFLADGEAAFQDIFHVHLHVFPHFPGDNFRIDADWRPRDRDELDQTAAVREGWNRLIDPLARPLPSEQGVNPDHKMGQIQISRAVDTPLAHAIGRLPTTLRPAAMA
jgi:hypothetical protein